MSQEVIENFIDRNPQFNYWYFTLKKSYTVTYLRNTWILYHSETPPENGPPPLKEGNRAAVIKHLAKLLDAEK